MVALLYRNRKSKVPVPSQLRCLAKTPSINITSGCVYCFAKGYSQYHGNGKVVLFSNIIKKLSEELASKRIKPMTVYFCPSCDLFQPIQEEFDNTYNIMEILLKVGISVQFSTKATVPVNFIELFSKYSNMVYAHISLNSVDDEIREIFEPATTSISEKLMTMQRFVEIGVATTVRVAPLIYGITDSDNSMVELFSAISKVEIKEVTMSFLFFQAICFKNSRKEHKR